MTGGWGKEVQWMYLVLKPGGGGGAHTECSIKQRAAVWCDVMAVGAR